MSKREKIQDYDFSLQENIILQVKGHLEEQFPQSPPLALVRTYGCQQNVNDGEKLQGMLTAMGYGLTEDLSEADLILYNTCAIRENAEDKVFGNLGTLTHYKKRKEHLIIGLCGCMAQQSHVVERIQKSYRHVDVVFGTHSLHLLPEIVLKKLQGQKRVFDIREMDGVIPEGVPIRRDGEYKAFLSIMYGCNKFCTYCIVPYVRGRERSRKPEDIIKEFTQLVQEGYKDITLLGQNVNSYGIGLEEEITFGNLLETLAQIPGDYRIRFMTSHPKDFTHEMVDVIAKYPNICNHIHLPFQSGNNRVLKEMNRHYTKEEYLERVSYAKKIIEGVTFTSDIIVGFPGETNEEFLETIEVVKEVGFNALFTFIYSKRKGTKAEQYPDPVSDEEKNKWFSKLIQVQREMGKKQYEKCLGKTYRVLVDGVGKSGEGYYTGKTDCNIQVDFLGEESMVGNFVTVTITDTLNWALLGKLN